MKVRSLEFDGSPEEFAKVSHMFAGAPSSAAPQAAVTAEGPALTPITTHKVSPEVTPELVLLVLERRYLDKNVRMALKVLLEAGPQGALSSEIAEAIGISRAQLAGVFGAFGRRMANTEGWPSEASFVSWERDHEARQWRYRLLPVVRQVFETGRFTL